VDEIAVIRSMYAQVPNHEPSLMLMNCGRLNKLTPLDNYLLLILKKRLLFIGVGILLAKI
jgi:hypothetical protein